MNRVLVRHVLVFARRPVRTAGEFALVRRIRVYIFPWSFFLFELRKCEKGGKGDGDRGARAYQGQSSEVVQGEDGHSAGGGGVARKDNAHCVF